MSKIITTDKISFNIDSSKSMKIFYSRLFSEWCITICLHTQELNLFLKTEKEARELYNNITNKL